MVDDGTSPRGPISSPGRKEVFSGKVLDQNGGMDGTVSRHSQCMLILFDCLPVVGEIPVRRQCSECHSCASSRYRALLLGIFELPSSASGKRECERTAHQTGVRLSPIHSNASCMKVRRRDRECVPLALLRGSLPPLHEPPAALRLGGGAPAHVGGLGRGWMPLERHGARSQSKFPAAKRCLPLSGPPVPAAASLFPSVLWVCVGSSQPERSFPLLLGRLFGCCFLRDSTTVISKSGFLSPPVVEF